MTDEEYQKKVQQFDGSVLVQSAGMHPNSEGVLVPALAVELKGTIGPLGLGRALGSIISAYAAKSELPPELTENERNSMHVAVMQAVFAGITLAVNEGEIVALSRGGVN